MAFALALWRLFSDLGWASAFVFSEGLLSHWQVWLAAAALIEFAAWALNRYGENLAAPSGNVPEPGGSLGRAKPPTVRSPVIR
jgi:hypothetical protein